MSSRMIIVLVSLALFAAALVLLVSNGPTLRNFPPSGRSVAILGDSIAAGVGASTPEKGFVSLVAQRLGVPIANSGRSGDTTEDGLARIDADVLAHDPDIVVIELGGNDHLKRVPVAQTFANLDLLISRAQEKGAMVVVLGIRGGLFGDGFDDAFDALSERCGCIVVPDILDGIFGDGRYMADPVHPNDRGHEKIADKVAPVLEGILAAAPAETPASAK